jgi:hypothetical protein
MSQDAPDQALDDLTEETAHQIIFTCQPGATPDPLPAVKRLLARYLEAALAHLGQIGAEETPEAQQ